MADILAVRDNIKKLVQAGAPEQDVDAYVQAEGFTPDQISQAGSAPQAQVLPPPADAQAAAPQTPDAAPAAAAPADAGSALNPSYLPTDRPPNTFDKGLAAVLKASPVGTFGQMAEDAKKHPFQAAAGAAMAIPGVAEIALPLRIAAGAEGQLGGQIADYLTQPKDNFNPGDEPVRALTTAGLGSAIGEAAGTVAGLVSRGIRGANNYFKPLREIKIGNQTPREASDVLSGYTGKDMSLTQFEKSDPSNPQGTANLKAAVDNAKNASAVGLDTKLGQMAATRQEGLKQALQGTDTPDVNLQDFSTDFAAKADDAAGKLDDQGNQILQGLDGTAGKVYISKTKINALADDLEASPKLNELLVRPGDKAAMNGFIKYLRTFGGSKTPLRASDLQSIFSAYTSLGKDNNVLSGMLWNDQKGLYPILREGIEKAGGDYGQQMLQAADNYFKAGNIKGSPLYAASKNGNPAALAEALGDQFGRRNNLVAMQTLYGGSAKATSNAVLKNIFTQLASTDGQITSKGIEDALKILPHGALEAWAGKEYSALVDAAQTYSTAAERSGLGTALQNVPGVETPGAAALNVGKKYSGASPIAGLNSVINYGKQALMRIRGNPGEDKLIKTAIQGNKGGTVAEKIKGFNSIDRTASGITRAGVANAGAYVNNPDERQLNADGSRESDLGSLIRTMESASPANDTTTVSSPNLQVQQFQSPNDGSGVQPVADPNQQKDPLGFLIGQLEQADGNKATSTTLPPNKMNQPSAEDSQELDNLIKQSVKESMPGVITKVGDASPTAAEEGLRLKAYKDKFGNKTVGVGFNMDSPGAKALWVKAGLNPADFTKVYSGQQALTDGQAQGLFKTTTADAEAKVAQFTPGYDKLGVYQKAALADLLFQVGETGYKKFSNMINAVKSGDLKSAANFMRNSLVGKQTPDRNLRRVYMLENNTDLKTAQNKLIEAGLIDAKHAVA